MNIGIEFRKGILFIRLAGSLNEKTVPILDEEVTSLIKQNEIRNVVFNLKELDSIDQKGIKFLLYNYDLCKNYKGQGLICNICNRSVYSKLKQSKIFKYLFETNDELSAINAIEF